MRLDIVVRTWQYKENQKEELVMVQLDIFQDETTKKYLDTFVSLQMK